MPALDPYAKYDRLFDAVRDANSVPTPDLLSAYSQQTFLTRLDEAENFVNAHPFDLEPLVHRNYGELFELTHEMTNSSGPPVNREFVMEPLSNFYTDTLEVRVSDERVVEVPVDALVLDDGTEVIPEVVALELPTYYTNAYEVMDAHWPTQIEKKAEILCLREGAALVGAAAIAAVFKEWGFVACTAIPGVSAIIYGGYRHEQNQSRSTFMKEHETRLIRLKGEDSEPPDPPVQTL